MKYIRALFFLSVCLHLFPQTSYPQHARIIENRLSAGFIQIDEALNYGLIFPGTGIGYDFTILTEKPSRIIEYSAGLGLNFLQTRKIAAANLHLSPLKFSWLYKPSGSSFAVGPFFVADYNYQIYPDLQSGYSFWFTHLSIGASARYSFSIKQKLFRISLESTVFGFTSRPQKYEDPYFFDLDVGYVLKSVNRNFHFSSLGNYNHSKVEIRWQHKPDSRLALAYNFAYHGYYKDPRFTMIDHRLSVILTPKSSVK